MSPAKFSRREFVRVSAITAVGSILAACAPTPAAPAEPVAPPAEPPAAPTTPPAAPPEAMGGEAPMLAEQVTAGTLPPLQERLPTQPKVITPFEEIGVYGETLNRGTLSVSDYIGVTQAHEPLFELPYPDLNSGPVEPNLAESWEFNEDGTVLTVNLRKGTRWSDGEPFTAEDVMFLWYDIWLTEDALTPPPTSIVIDDEVVGLDMVDDFTLTFTFPRPYYYSEFNFASMSEWAWPKHYFEQYHPKYNPDATWEAFQEQKPWAQGRGRVTLQAWMLEDYRPDVGLTIARNPYYWKVDTAGNQLPYIDKNIWWIVEDRPTIALKCVAGEFDLDGMWVGIPQIPLFFAEQEARGFRIGWWQHVEAWAMWPNYDYPDPDFREVVRNVNFRRAVSVALDREEMNRTFYFDLVTIFGSTFFPGVTPFYTDEAGALYAQYDPEEAKRLLDEAGIVDVDGDGFRETPNGTPLDLVIDVYQHDLYVPLMEAVLDMLAAVGLKATLNIQQQDAIFNRRPTDEWMFTVGDIIGFHRPLQQLNTLIPVGPNTPWWHKSASEAPMSPEYEEFISILKAATGLPRDEMISEMQRAGLIAAENVWMWGIGSMQRPYFVGTDLRNCPMTAVRLPDNEPPLRPYQLYIVRES